MMGEIWDFYSGDDSYYKYDCLDHDAVSVSGYQCCRGTHYLKLFHFHPEDDHLEDIMFTRHKGIHYQTKRCHNTEDLSIEKLRNFAQQISGVTK
jgi:hypothetical protein